ncbi:MAG: aminotransferase class I/II-fold pyridoxal phosphate-dependent enzyme [Propionibacteriaceae bacterium]|jgi:cystathionine gamma-synthase|nr:aminotransferase class I/II-fold pyridoxal phosphate-dependent enzyme [Propionibacteriaceae bacterium]
MARHFATDAVHVGQEVDSLTGAIVPPLVLASTFAMDVPGQTRVGYDYSRSGNPTRTAYEQALAAAEGGVRALAFPSGLSAEDTVLRALTVPGDLIAYSHDVYGGTYRLLEKHLPAEGKRALAVDAADLDSLAAAISRHRPKVVWVETPSNPLLEIADIQAIAELAHESGGLLVVDNTFASPALQRPLALGADVVVHSTTKSIGGHSDLIGGAAVFANGDDAERVYSWQNSVGAVPGTFDVWLAHRGLKTLDTRVRAMSVTAGRLAVALREVPGVVRVLYPGLPEHPGHDLAKRQMDGFGSVLSVELANAETAKRVCERTSIFTLAVSLGAVESLIEHPASMTHGVKQGSMHESPDNLIRLSIGLEGYEDLLEDLKTALRAT